MKQFLDLMAHIIVFIYIAMAVIGMLALIVVSSYVLLKISPAFCSVMMGFVAFLILWHWTAARLLK